jgi:hypothetical protein
LEGAGVLFKALIAAWMRARSAIKSSRYAMSWTCQHSSCFICPRSKLQDAQFPKWPTHRKPYIELEELARRFYFLAVAESAAGAEKMEAYRPPNRPILGMGQGLESSPDPLGTTRRAVKPVLVALNAPNWLAHGGRLTAGCPAFSVITAPLAFRDDRAITRSPKCRAAGAIAPRPAHRRERGSG